MNIASNVCSVSWVSLNIFNGLQWQPSGWEEGRTVQDGRDVREVSTAGRQASWKACSQGLQWLQNNSSIEFGEEGQSIQEWLHWVTFHFISAMLEALGWFGHNWSAPLPLWRHKGLWYPNPCEYSKFKHAWSDSSWCRLSQSPVIRS